MALVRLKRSLDEEQVDTLLIAYKKRKEDANQTSVFKFATTLTEKEDVYQHIPKVFDIVDTKILYKQKQITNIAEKLRKENKLYSQNSRLKLVNCLRKVVDSTNDDEKELGLPKSEVTILEVESNGSGKDNQCPSTSNSEVKSFETSQYVYDIYYAPNTLSDIDVAADDSEISCHVIDNEMIYEDTRDDVYVEEVEEDEDDSNDENNWRNEYPDDDDDDSILEEDMKLATQYSGLKLDDDDEDLSSDEKDEMLLNSVDVSDVAMYGEGYAKYKRKVNEDFGEFYVDESDDEDREYYNDYVSSSFSDTSNDDN